MTTTPFLSVAVSTRNRGAPIAGTVQTILANKYAAFELRLVDQSTNTQTRNAVEPFMCDPRFCYTGTPQRGIARGRNQGIASAQGEFVAMTDDDCQVPSNWLQEIAAAFQMDSRIGIVMGNILPAPHDPAAGFIQSYVRNKPFLARSIRDKHHVEGTAACMAVRKSLWQKLGGFDEMLGSGAPFKAAEETDLIIRALLAGYYVYETPRVTVTHSGFRTWEQAKEIIPGYIGGLTAMFVKHLKCGNWSVLYPFLQLTRRWAFGHPAVNFGRQPSRRMRFNGFVSGLFKGLATPVNRRTVLYIDPRT